MSNEMEQNDPEQPIEGGTVMQKSSCQLENQAPGRRSKLPAWSMLEKERLKFVSVAREQSGAHENAGEPAGVDHPAKTTDGEPLHSAALLARFHAANLKSA